MVDYGCHRAASNHPLDGLAKLTILAYGRPSASHDSSKYFHKGHHLRAETRGRFEIILRYEFLVRAHVEAGPTGGYFALILNFQRNLSCRMPRNPIFHAEPLLCNGFWIAVSLRVSGPDVPDLQDLVSKCRVAALYHLLCVGCVELHVCEGRLCFTSVCRTFGSLLRLLFLVFGFYAGDLVVRGSARGGDARIHLERPVKMILGRKKDHSNGER